MAIINGTNNNDVRTGTELGDTINGFAGNDVLNGLNGNDVLVGGSGNNTLNGGLGIDTASYVNFFFNGVNASLETGTATFPEGTDSFISIENLVGSQNNDVLTGNIFNNKLDGGNGFDTLSSGGGDDVLKGGNGADILDGGDGNDFLTGDRGNDTMIGGAGNDTFGWVDGDGSDVIQGGFGADSLFFIGSTNQGDQLTLNQVGSEVLLQRINLAPITLRLQGVETFNTISGGGGDDRLIIENLNVASGVTSVAFDGGDGNDLLFANSSSNSPFTATLVAITGSGGSGNDRLTGGNGNDQLIGGQGNDTLVGGGGNDTLTGSSFATGGRGEIDLMFGGLGQDTFVVRNLYNDGNNLADGDAGNFFNGIDGTADFARILDFRSGEDIIELSGARSSYVLKPITNSLRGGSAALDMGIFRKNGPTLFQPDELVAIVQDIPPILNLNNRSQFRFV